MNSQLQASAALSSWKRFHGAYGTSTTVVIPQRSQNAEREREREREREAVGVYECVYQMGGEKCIQSFGGETWGQETTWKTQGKIILKWIFEKWDGWHVMDRPGSGQGQVAGCCECGNEPPGPIKCGEFLE